MIRHGEPTLSGVFLGSLDPGLSETGWKQARAIQLDSAWPVYASPLRRAQETASVFRTPVTLIEEFREISYGPWEGLRWDEIEQRFPEEAARKLADWLGYTVPGAESWSAFRKRVAVGLRRIEGSAIVVAHLGVNSVLRELSSGESPLNFQQDYGGLVRLKL